MPLRANPADEPAHQTQHPSLQQLTRSRHSGRRLVVKGLTDRSNCIDLMHLIQFRAAEVSRSRRLPWTRGQDLLG